jgi:hypothetical protein
MKNNKAPRTSKDEEREKSLRAYLMYQEMMRTPLLVKEMRDIFLSALAERGIATKEDLEKQARELAKRAGEADREETVGEYVDALTDLTFSTAFSGEEIDNYINLARKEELLSELIRVLNTENVTYRQIKQALYDFCAIPEGKLFLPATETEGVRVELINHFISNQLPYIGIAKNHITVRDIGDIVERTCWNKRRHGRIGGKAAGMMLAYKVLIPRLEDRDPELERFIAIPESYYFSSGIFADFIDYNGLERFHVHKYGSREEIEKRYREIPALMEQASFPPDVLGQFRDFLEQVGEHPLVVRSSSYLEDSFGHAFSGKYDSIFFANNGDIELRLQGFIRAYKEVLGSALAFGPILYRRDHGLLDFDEQMGVLVQKVVGHQVGDYFFPTASGVAFSYNAYNWSPRIDKEQGLVRLVYGLGTHAVDRVGRDYPRMVPLSHPLLRPETGAEQIAHYSQRQVDALNLKTGALEVVPFVELAGIAPGEDLFPVVSCNEAGNLAAPMFKTQAMDPRRSCITFENLLTRTGFTQLMKKVLDILQRAYGNPVDVEFAWEEDKLYILQCRPLLVTESLEKITIPEDIPEEMILFTNDTFVSNDVVPDIEYVVYVDPKAYSLLETFEEKLAIGRAVGELNHVLEGKRYVLFGPGRWGSNDINLGVRVSYEDINHTLILGEIAFAEEGSTPEVSYGTHFFIDLVEASIVAIAIFPDKPDAVFREDYFLRSPNELEKLAPGLASHSRVIRVIHVPDTAQGRFFQVYQDGNSQRGVGFLGHPGEYTSQGGLTCEVS